jgi:hypothetical protein
MVHISGSCRTHVKLYSSNSPACRTFVLQMICCVHPITHQFSYIIFIPSALPVRIVRKHQVHFILAVLTGFTFKGASGTSVEPDSSNFLI